MPAPAPYYLPRVLIFLGSIWLIGSWALSIGLRPPVHQSSSSYEPGVRMLVLCLVTGIVVGWPLLRLSQARIGSPVRQIMLDLAVLLSMLQVTIWPIRLVTTWSVTRTALLDAVLIGWILLIGAVLVVAIALPRGGPRVIAMLGCVALGGLGPLVAVFGASIASATMGDGHPSPYAAVIVLTDTSTPVAPRHVNLVMVTLAAALTAWIAVTLLQITQRSSASQTPEERVIASR